MIREFLWNFSENIYISTKIRKNINIRRNIGKRKKTTRYNFL